MNILIIRSAPLARYEEAYRAVVAEYPDAVISVVTHSTSNEAVQAVGQVSFFNYHARAINPFTVGLNNILALRRKKFDRIIILCINHLGDGYGWIKVLTFLIGAPNIELWNVQGKRLPVIPRKYLWQTFLWYASMAVYAVIWFCLFVKAKLEVFFTELRRTRQGKSHAHRN